jgi:hypothetical protein
MSPSRRETRAFVVAHAVLLGLVLLGFARTFYLRKLFLPSPLPDRLVVHGVALTLWFCLVVVQGILALSGSRAWHARIAWLAVPVVAAIVVTGLHVTTVLAMTLVSADEPENMFIWANYLSVASLTVLIGAAVRQRRNVAAHRRLILFASILMTGPALGRIALWPALKLGLAAAPVVALGGMALLAGGVVLYDMIGLRRVHMATVGGLAGIVLPWLGGTAVAVSGVGFALLHVA